MSRRIALTPLRVLVFVAVGALATVGVLTGSGSGPIHPAIGSMPAASATPTDRPAPSALPSPTPSPIPTDRLQATLDRLVRKLGIPGASVTILWPDGRSWTGTSGLADVATQRPVTAQTEFGIASMSKTFLGALIFRLVEEGRLSLDQAVAPLLPGVRVGKTVTVRMLLDHTSGLADFFFGKGIDKALLSDRGATWTAARALGYVGKPYFPPGSGWHYSNTNYLLLGLIAERVGGAPVATQLRARFFDPLGLTGAYVQLVEPPPLPVAHGYAFDRPGIAARPRDVSDGSSVMPFTSVVSAAGSAGDVAATSEDLARWARALYGGQVLQHTTLADAIRDVRLTARFHPYVPYGLGIQVTRINGRVAFGHTGQLLGFRGELRYLPAAGLAIAIVTNQNRIGTDSIVAALLKIALPAVALAPPPPIGSPSPGLPASPWPGTSALPEAPVAP